MTDRDKGEESAAARWGPWGEEDKEKREEKRKGERQP
jgi:hypothetical protein